ncbi:MAG: CpaF family protein [Actinomycetota bacterium]
MPQALLDLIDDEQITDLCISESKTEVDRGKGLEVIDRVLDSESEVAWLARELIELGGRRLDQANPFADVSLPGGLRIHAVLASACSPQTLLSIRLHNPNPPSLKDLLAQEFLTPPQEHFLRGVISRRESFLIAGSTGSGKTTLLRGLLAELNERIIAIEDTSELASEKVISLQSRSANIERQGEIDLAELVRQSLRMRPDRIVVGEVRGRELTVMLQALNTGHCGATTIHANSLSSVPERLMAIASAELTDTQLARLTVAAFDWVFTLEVQAGTRMLNEIGKFQLVENQLRVQKVLVG